MSRSDFPAFLTKTLQTAGGLDANDRMWQLKAMMAQDVTHGKGTIEEAAARTRAQQLIIVSQYDHLVNPAPGLAWAHAIHAQTFVSHGDCGHRITVCDGDSLTAVIRQFLSGIQNPQ